MTHATVSSLGERALIARITARLATPPWVVVGPGDDAAVLQPERGALEVLTTDAHVDGVHFDLRFAPPEALGHRALAVNLSDLAAMGAAPRAALLSLLLPDSLTVDVVDRMMDGLLALAAKYRVAIVGGNVTRTTGPLAVDVTAVGTVGPRRAMTRGGARAGDEVYVTGTLGDAAVGLSSLRDGTASGQASVERYLYPDPRVRAGLLLGRNRAASSCMDLSDGLADAVRQVAEASRVGIIIEEDAIPISTEVRAWHERTRGSTIQTALTAGDDYELLFTVRPAQRGRLRTALKQLGDLRVTRIGVVTKQCDVLLRGAGGLRELPQGYDHFR